MACPQRAFYGLSRLLRVKGICFQRSPVSTGPHQFGPKEAIKSPVEHSGPQGGELQTSFAQKTKENVKTASYSGVILVGLGVTGVVIYNLFDELFSGDSPNSLFQQAADKCMAHQKVQDLLGEPIKAFGEETRRGRRRHVSYLDYVDDDGKKGVRVRFYLQGRRQRATCQIDAREDSSGHMKTRFIIVQSDDLVKNTVIVEDNR